MSQEQNRDESIGGPFDDIRSCLQYWGKLLGVRKLELASVNFKVPVLKKLLLGNDFGASLEMSKETRLDQLDAQLATGGLASEMIVTADEGSVTMYEVAMYVDFH